MNREGTGQKLYIRAKEIIPGGTQLLSKRGERFLPELWPAYYSKAKGCEIWDLDGNHFYDFAQMGVGSVALGYADPDVNAAVVEAVANGSMASLNCKEEVDFAEKLIGFHPWADMARFTRSGGEACAVAVRIARATTKRDLVAFCGYHGWHDWYLAANLADNSNLDAQLLPGLAPNGVPRPLRGTAITFHYNNTAEIEAIVNEFGDRLAAIYMEPMRSVEPAPGFLERVRELATASGACLIFDEVTSGFRRCIGGVHKMFGVDPDIAVFGKAIGNGFPISAVIGRRKFMDAAKESFISSTFWTERVGFAAGLACLNKIERENVPERLEYLGGRIRDIWFELGKKHDIPLKVTGIPALSCLAFTVEDPKALQTLYAQEMLKRGYLLGAAVYATYAYTDEILDMFQKDSDAVFAYLKESLDQKAVKDRLEGPVLESGFARLT